MRYSAFYELVKYEIDKTNNFQKTENANGYIVDMGNIDNFILILSRIFRNVKQYVEEIDYDFVMPNFEELSLDLVITKDKMESFFEQSTELMNLESIKKITDPIC